MTAVNACATLADLQAPSKLMMKQVTDLVFTKLRFELIPVDMPQDILGEESKDNIISSERKLVQWMREFDAKIKRKTEEIS